MSEIEVHRLSDVRVLGHREEPETAVLKMVTAEGSAHYFDMTEPELCQMAFQLLSAARTLSRHAPPAAERH